MIPQIRLIADPLLGPPLKSDQLDGFRPNSLCETWPETRLSSSNGHVFELSQPLYSKAKLVIGTDLPWVVRSKTEPKGLPSNF